MNYSNRTSTATSSRHNYFMQKMTDNRVLIDSKVTEALATQVFDDKTEELPPSPVEPL